MKKNKVNILIFFVLYFFTLSTVNSQIVASDTSFWEASLNELRDYKVYYLQKLESLQEEKRILIERGIEDGEKILQRDLDPDLVDDILIRLADLYYFKEKDTYLDQMEEYNRALDLSMQDSSVQIPSEPSLDFSHTFSLYQRIIDEYPESEKVDDAVYNMGFLYEEQGNADRAHQFYLHLIDKFPESNYVTEAQMRLGEYYFNPPQNDIIKAITYYKKVIQKKQGSHYHEALYKLGWSYFRLSQYPEAISFFTNLVENIRKNRISEEDSELISVDLYDEALEYIAVCFMDFGELNDILDYLKSIDNPDWGEKVLSEFGDIYFNKREQYRKAIKTYTSLLDYNPFSPNAPVVQKKIINCYIVLEDEKQIYLNRKKLFDSYNTDSDWWQKTEDIDALGQANELTEEALRKNINYLLGKAEEKENLEIYKSVVDLGYTYLDYYSEHVNAYMIRWNIALVLDIRLNAYEEALKEYMTISMVYNTPKYKDYARRNGLSTIKNAAKNAVVVADSLVQKEKRSNTKSYISEISPETENPLSKAEQLLVMACDNYIKLFPFDINTPTVLANVGALFYLHKKYNEAIKYYKTLTKYFPESEQIYVVQLSITKSYLGKKDYKSAEALAVRLLKHNLPPEIKKKVKKLYGQAIFLKAQQLATSGQSNMAAAEYLRVATEVPLLDFADRALFNAAREFEKIANLDYAIRSYNQLIHSYAGSNLYIDALNNLAYDYAEIEEFEKSAEKYEQLAGILSDSSESKDAFFNAYTYYVKSNNWYKAIETGEKWISQYPQAPETPKIHYDLADHYHQVNDLDKALHIYQRYPILYPENSYSVDAFFQTGQMLYNKGLKKQAEKAYYFAHKKNEQFKEKGVEPHDYFAAEGLFKASKLMHERYKNKLSETSYYSFQNNIRSIHVLLDSLLYRYQQVVKYKSKRLPECLFRIGEIYEQFSEAVQAQELPYMSAGEKAVKRNEILFQCEEIYQQAFNKYSKALPVLRKIESQIKGTDKQREQFAVKDSSDWLLKIEYKVSEMLFNTADLNKEAVKNLLAVPVPSDLFGLERLEYKKQLLLTTIRPLIEKAIRSHKSTIFLSDSLQLANSWMDSSRNEVMYLIDFLPRKFIDLTFEGLIEFREASERFRNYNLMERKQPDIDTINNLVNLIESAELYANLVMELYLDKIETINDLNFISLKDLPLQERLVDFTLSVTDSIDHYMFVAQNDKNKADQLFADTNDFVYESCLTAFEDHIYFLNKFEMHLLENVYVSLAEQKYRSDNLFKLAVKLIKQDPEQYSRTLGIPLARITCKPDSTWKVAHTFYKGWEKSDFSVENWDHYNNRNFNQGPTNNTLFSGSDLVDYYSYLRKTIHIAGFPVLGRLEINNRNILEIFVNGDSVKINDNGDRYLITSMLQQKKNVFAVKILKNVDFRLEDFIEISYIRKGDVKINR